MGLNLNIGMGSHRLPVQHSWSIDSDDVEISISSISESIRSLAMVPKSASTMQTSQRNQPIMDSKRISSMRSEHRQVSDVKGSFNPSLHSSFIPSFHPSQVKESSSYSCSPPTRHHVSWICFSKRYFECNPELIWLGWFVAKLNLLHKIVKLQYSWTIQDAKSPIKIAPSIVLDLRSWREEFALWVALSDWMVIRLWVKWPILEQTALPIYGWVLFVFIRLY